MRKKELTLKLDRQSDIESEMISHLTNKCVASQLRHWLFAGVSIHKNYPGVMNNSLKGISVSHTGHQYRLSIGLNKKEGSDIEVNFQQQVLALVGTNKCNLEQLILLKKCIIVGYLFEFGKLILSNDKSFIQENDQANSTQSNTIPKLNKLTKLNGLTGFVV